MRQNLLSSGHHAWDCESLSEEVPKDMKSQLYGSYDFDPVVTSNHRYLQTVLRAQAVSEMRSVHKKLHVVVFMKASDWWCRAIHAIHKQIASIHLCSMIPFDCSSDKNC